MGKAIRISDLNLSRGNIGQVTPASFNKLQYISSTGTQYIDTGVLVKSGLHIVLKMKFTEATSVMGGDGGFATNAFSFIIASNVPRRPYLTYGSQNIQLNNGQVISGSYTFDFNDNVWAFKTLNGSTVVLTKTFNKETFTGSSNIYLFGISRNNSVVSSALFKGSIYECQIYDGDTLIRDYVAAERVQDDKAGLYDKLNDVFYINQGTGEFEKGPYAE